MILFYYGTDSGRMSAATSALKARYRAKHGGTNLFVSEADEPESFNAALGALKARSFFSEPTLITIRGVFENATGAAALDETLKDKATASDKDTVLVIWNAGTEKDITKANRPLWKTLSEQAKTTTFEPLSGSALQKWMQAYCAERHCTLAGPIASRLVATVGDDSWVLMNELSKLCAWQQRGDITAQAVVALATPTDRQANVFALTDALSDRNKRNVIRELDHQLGSGNDPHYLLAMYAFAIRNLITIKDLAGRGLTPPAIAKKAGLHPYVTKKGLASCRGYESHELDYAHAWLTQADQETKRGIRDTTDALYDFVLTVL